MTAHDIVLIIDDEAMIREALVDVLEFSGIRAIAVGDGRSGTELFAARRAEIGLVILDLMMPVMDGAQTLRLLRAVDPQVKVALFTGCGEVEALRRLAVLDGNIRPTAFLQKPCDMDDLVNTVRTLMDG